MAKQKFYFLCFYQKKTMYHNLVLNSYELRKVYGMTQEKLAEICGVSRQSISKWEADIALPETEKLLLLGEVFHVSMDVLLKDEMSLGEIKDVQCCGNNAILQKKQEVYEGMLIKESLTDDSVIDYMHVHGSLTVEY